MNAHTHSHDSAHVGHEMEDFEGGYAIWAIPFSLIMLIGFVLIVVLWAPAAASREMKIKEQQGAEASRQSLLDHRALEAETLEKTGVKQAMAELVRRNATYGTP
jgi:ABC-type protease/lipase transport system fused ATPase/permease subunit